MPGSGLNDAGTAGLPRCTHRRPRIPRGGAAARAGRRSPPAVLPFEVLVPEDAKRVLSSLLDVVSGLGRLLPKAGRALELLPEFLRASEISALRDVAGAPQVCVDAETLRCGGPRSFRLHFSSDSNIGPRPQNTGQRHLERRGATAAEGRPGISLKPAGEALACTRRGVAAVRPCAP